ncbi:hypothetical protein TNCV_1577541 [Trichonephila clavipes]|nr:hypothetical protein TNCV_1577541 [Trichonephila clavipes]
MWEQKAQKTGGIGNPEVNEGSLLQHLTIESIFTSVRDSITSLHHPGEHCSIAMEVLVIASTIHRCIPSGNDQEFFVQEFTLIQH